jgi:hypothetical protein
MGITNTCHQLLAIFLMVALHSPKAEIYTASIQQKLDEDSMYAIMNLVTEVGY